MKKFIKKGIKIIKRGDILGYARKYVRRKTMFKLVPNKNIQNLALQDIAYRKLYDEFKPIIDEGIHVEGKQEKNNKVWICWFQGLDNAPDLVKACVESVRRNLNDREIIIINNENIHDYVQFPNCIEKKLKDGIIKFAHFSDLLRVELLCKYGGMWIDSTVLCTNGEFANYIAKLPFFNYVGMDLSRMDYNPIIASSWLISACSNHPILLLTRKLLYSYWEKYSHLEHPFLLHLFLAMAANRYKEEWESIPVFNNHSPHTVQFELQNEYNEERWKQLLKMSDFHKLNHRKVFADGNTVYNHILKTYLKLKE